MKTVILTGRLGKEFGPQFEFAASSPAECIRALCYQVKGFEAALKEGEYQLTKIYAEGSEDPFDEEAIGLYFGKAIGFRIDPVVGGAKKRGLGKLILGIVIVGAAFFTGGGSLAGGSLFAGTAAEVSLANVAFQGGMMALSGASMLLSPTPGAADPQDQNESFMINATGNIYEQGNPVPIVFGEVFTGSVVISKGIASEDTVSGNPLPPPPPTPPPPVREVRDISDR